MKIRQLLAVSRFEKLRREGEDLALIEEADVLLSPFIDHETPLCHMMHFFTVLKAKKKSKKVRQSKKETQLGDKLEKVRTLTEAGLSIYKATKHVGIN